MRGVNVSLITNGVPLPDSVIVLVEPLNVPLLIVKILLTVISPPAEKVLVALSIVKL